MRKYNKYRCQTHEVYVNHEAELPAELVEEFRKEYPYIKLKKLRKLLLIYD